MGFLDNTGLAKLWLKITSKLSGKVDTTTTVNGHPLSSNVTVTQQDIGINYSSTEPSNPSDGDIWLQPESESNILHDTDIASSAITGKNTVNAALTQLNSNFGGATSSANGSKGLVPAPLAGAQHKFLCADGDWADAPGSQTYVETVGPLTPTNGVLNQNFAISYVMAEMKAIQVEPSDASVFMDTLTVTMSEGNINVSCPNMTGTCQSMAITFVLRSSAQGETITSSEFNILATRIGNLESLTTTAKASAVAAINEVKSGVSTLNDQIGDLDDDVTSLENATADSGWQQIAITQYSTEESLKYRKIGNVVTVVIPNQSYINMTENFDNTIAILPIGYRPVSLVVTRNYGVDGYLLIDTNGSVRIHPTLTNMHMSATFTYIVA